MRQSAESAELLPTHTDNSWPWLETSLAGADRIRSNTLGRWTKGVVVRLALAWLTISIGLVMLQMARDSVLKTWRRDSTTITATPQGEEG